MMFASVPRIEEVRAEKDFMTVVNPFVICIVYHSSWHWISSLSEVSTVLTILVVYCLGWGMFVGWLVVILVCDIKVVHFKNSAVSLNN